MARDRLASHAESTEESRSQNIIKSRIEGGRCSVSFLSGASIFPCPEKLDQVNLQALFLVDEKYRQLCEECTYIIRVDLNLYQTMH